MAEPSSISNPTAPPKTRKRTRSDPTRRIRTEFEQHSHSSNLINCVRALRRANSAATTARRGAEDRILVDSTKGRTRWSRALLKRRLKRKHNRPGAGLRKSMAWKKKERLQRKMRLLSRLIPGCRNLSLTNVVEETTNHIAALEMQVKAVDLFNALVKCAALALILSAAYH